MNKNLEFDIQWQQSFQKQSLSLHELIEVFLKPFSILKMFWIFRELYQFVLNYFLINGKIVGGKLGKLPWFVPIVMS